MQPNMGPIHHSGIKERQTSTPVLDIDSALERLYFEGSSKENILLCIDAVCQQNPQAGRALGLAWMQVETLARAFKPGQPDFIARGAERLWEDAVSKDGALVEALENAAVYRELKGVPEIMAAIASYVQFNLDGARSEK